MWHCKIIFPRFYPVRTLQKRRNRFFLIAQPVVDVGRAAGPGPDTGLHGLLLCLQQQPKMPGEENENPPPKQILEPPHAVCKRSPTAWHTCRNPTLRSTLVRLATASILGSASACYFIVASRFSSKPPWFSREGSPVLWLLHAVVGGS